MLVKGNVLMRQDEGVVDAGEWGGDNGRWGVNGAEWGVGVDGGTDGKVD